MNATVNKQYKKERLKEILSGNVPDDLMMKYLAELEDEDSELINNDDELKRLFETYKQENMDKDQALPFFTKKEKDVLWDTIIADTPKKEGESARKLMNSGLSSMTSWFGDAMEKKRLVSAVTCAIVLLIIIPAVIHMNAGKGYIGSKGPGTIKAKVMYALYNDGALVRGSRVFSDGQTLAFRIVSDDKAYFSLYVVNKDMKDLVIQNHLLEAGAHDLKQLYTLNGNTGENTVVLICSDGPTSLNKDETKQLLNTLVNDRVQQSSISNRIINVYYNTFEVNDVTGSE